ncbi:hypothetical protein VV97_12040 [Vibrio vulnificus]|nr:hypothetical protein VV97_12040 [Vibrio vulnificus]
MGNNIEQPNSNTGNEAVIPNHTTCCTMGPRVREDDENKKKSRAKFSGKEQKTLHSTTSPAVIPVHTGNHLSTRTGCRV